MYGDRGGMIQEWSRIFVEVIWTWKLFPEKICWVPKPMLFNCLESSMFSFRQKLNQAFRNYFHI